MSSPLDCSNPVSLSLCFKIVQFKVLLVDKTVETFWEMKFNGLSGVFRIEAC